LVSGLDEVPHQLTIRTHLPLRRCHRAFWRSPG